MDPWGEPEPAAATPLGHGGTATAKQMGLAQSVVNQVALQLAAEPASDERNQLLIEWGELNDRIRAFLTAAHDDRVAQLRAQLEDVLAQGRAAHDKWKACVSEAKLYEGRVNAHLETLNKARLELKKAKADRPDPEEWPTKAELAKYNEHLAAVQGKADSVEAKHRELSVEIEKAKARTQVAKGELQALQKQRDQLQSQLGERRAERPASSVFGLGL